MHKSTCILVAVTAAFSTLQAVVAASIAQPSASGPASSFKAARNNLARRDSTQNESSQIIYRNPLKLAYMEPPFISRNFTQPYAPEDLQDTPHFQVYDNATAGALLGNSPKITLLVESPSEDFDFAHEAPVYFPDDDSFYWCSNAGSGGSNISVNNQIFRFSDLGTVIHRAKSGRASYDRDVEKVNVDSKNVQMTNGGTYYDGNLLVVNQGRGDKLPPSITLIDRENPKKIKTLLNNVGGKQFNSLNDIVVHPRSGYLFFTDPIYGQLQEFRSKPDLAPMTWAYSPLTGQLTPLDATGVMMPNGLVLSPDLKTVYIADSSALRTSFQPNRAATDATIVYAFDLIEVPNKGSKDASDVTYSLRNRRVFSYVDTGSADGIKVDSKGNVYGATGDGIDVWTPSGQLVLRVYLPGGGPNLAFTGDGRIVATADTKMWLIELDDHVKDPGLAHRPDEGKAVKF